MKSLLVVDPSESSRAMMKWAATNNGYLITDTGSINEALLYFNLHQFNFLLVDESLSQQLINQIKPFKHLTTIFIICDSAVQIPVINPPPNVQIDYLFRPFNELSLILRMEKYLKPAIGQVLIFDISDHAIQMKRSVEMLGFDVTIIDSDKDLKKITSELNPTLVIMNVSMPPLNRNAAIAHIKSVEIPTIAFISENKYYPEIGPILKNFDDFISPLTSSTELEFRIKNLIKSVPTTAGQSSSSTSTIEPKNDSVDEKLLLNQVHVTLHHEIKSPLTGILIGAQALSKRVTTEERPVLSEIIESAKKIQHTLDRLSSSTSIKSEEYLNGTQMAKFDTPSTPTFHWI